MARRRKRKRRATGKGKFCMMLRKGRGKGKSVTRCYSSEDGMRRALNSAYSGRRVFDSVLLYRRKRA